MEVEFFWLHRKPELLEATAKLINTEWPRSLAARVQSIQDGKDTLPCSLIACVGDRVVGHVRVLEVLGKEGAVIVESLLVDPSVRGRGLGRKLMEDAENLARSLGCKTVHLSTHDQQAFYQHLGYQEAAPVTGARKCLTKLKTQASDHEFLRLVADEGSTSTRTSNSSQCSTETIAVLLDSGSAPPSLSPPPLPPPPPPPSSLNKCTQQEGTKWLKKFI